MHSKVTVTVTMAASMIWACGESQVDSKYRGEPLMTIHGSVVNSEVALSSDLVPAVQFRGLPWGREHGGSDERVTYKNYVIKSEVEGTFPSAFTMRVYEPPPAEVLFRYNEGDPASVIATIVAVPTDHPKWLQLDSVRNDAGARVNTVCADDGECHVFDFTPCLDPNGKSEACRELRNAKGYWTLHGSVGNYQLLYVADEAPAGGVLSKMYAQGRAIAKGYHLLERDTNAFERRTEEQILEMMECWERADALAVKNFNVRRGTKYPGGEAIVGAVDARQFHEFVGDENAARVELGCAVEEPPTLVGNPEETPLKLTMRAAEQSW